MATGLLRLSGPADRRRYCLGRQSQIVVVHVGQFSNANFGIQAPDTFPHVTLDPGEKHRVQFCATADVAKKVHHKSRSGTPLDITIHWTHAVKGSSVGASLQLARANTYSNTPE
jgi:hypothetical protein